MHAVAELHHAHSKVDTVPRQRKPAVSKNSLNKHCPGVILHCVALHDCFHCCLYYYHTLPCLYYYHTLPRPSLTPPYTRTFTAGESSVLAKGLGVLCVGFVGQDSQGPTP